MFKALQNSLLSIIYPQQCRICSRQVTGLDAGVACDICWESARFFEGKETLCDKCGAFLDDAVSHSTALCRRCDGHHYDKAIAIGVYEGALAAVIVALKTTPVIPSRLYDQLHKRLIDLGGSIDLIIPVPLSRQRKHERGFNQAEVIADAVAATLRRPVDRSSLIRKVNTPAHRIAMDQRARELTVVNAFEVKRPKLIAKRSILLVDDVLTSGETASACARVLKKSGAASVSVFTLARAVMH